VPECDFYEDTSVRVRWKRKRAVCYRRCFLGVGESRRQWTSFVFGRVSSGGKGPSGRVQVYVEINLPCCYISRASGDWRRVSDTELCVGEKNVYV